MYAETCIHTVVNKVWWFWESAFGSTVSIPMVLFS